MACSDIADWFLTNRVPVINLRSRRWRDVSETMLRAGYRSSVCLSRLEQSGAVQRIQNGLYLVPDKVRATPPIAIASAIYADEPHYVTTDAALAFHRSIDQPIPVITVVCEKRHRAVNVVGVTINPVGMTVGRVRGADAYKTRVDGFAVQVATREQAIIDALDHPAWMTHFSLLPEILRGLDRRSLTTVASGAMARSTAAAQRLGYLIEEAGVDLPRKLVSLKPGTTHIELRPGNRTGIYSTRWGIYA